MEIIDGVRVLYRLSEDDLLRAKALREEKRIRDERTALDHATKEGLAKGRAEERADILAAFRGLGIDEETIRRAIQVAETNNGNN
jgi:hypothetical protein